MTKLDSNFTFYHALAIALVIYFYVYGFDSKDFSKISKITFSKRFGVDKKTFNKWVFYFAPELYPNFQEYLQRRKLYQYECEFLIEVLGDPADFPVLTKQQIIEKGEGTYRSLRECIQQFPDSFQIEPAAYQNLRKFPPAVSKVLLEQYA